MGNIVDVLCPIGFGDCPDCKHYKEMECQCPENVCEYCEGYGYDNKGKKCRHCRPNEVSMAEYSDDQLVELQDEVNFILSPKIEYMNEEELFDAWIEAKMAQEYEDDQNE